MFGSFRNKLYLCTRNQEHEIHTREAAARCSQSHLSLINTHTHYGKSILSVEAEQGEELEGEWQVVRPSEDH